MISNQGESAPTINGHSQHYATENDWQIASLDVNRIVPSPFQPRQNFDEAELQELAASIKAYDVQQPILVRPLDQTAKKPRFELIAGERRWRASQLAGRKTIPGIVRPMSDLAAAEIAVIENVQRANLSVIEEARGYKQLALKFRLKEERIAKKVGKSVHTIREMLRLLQLPEPVQTLLAQRKLTAAHGHELLRLAAHPQICEAVAHRAVRDKITATSLAANILPNAPDLKRSHQITELGYGTKFDWRSLCKECPHKALVSAGYQSYCLRPDEWKRKQNQAIELEAQEAARVMEEARQKNDGAIEREDLAKVNYRRLEGMQPPAGCCESCECRSETFDIADPTRRVPICLNPQRLEELRAAERQVHENARKERYTQEWKEAVENLQNAENGAALVASLLLLPILRAEYRAYVPHDVWQQFVGGIVSYLGCELPVDPLLQSRVDPYDSLKLLRDIPPQSLLLVGAGVLLGQEVERAVRYVGDTPLLDFVLGREKPVQTEIGKEYEAPEYGDDEDDYAEYPDGYEDEDYEAVAETETEVEENFGVTAGVAEVFS